MKQTPSKKSSKKDLPALKQFIGGWTLLHQPSAAREWSLEEKIKQAKKAGFDAFSGGPATPELRPLCEKHGLEVICNVSADAGTYAGLLEAIKPMRPSRVDVQFCDHDTPPREAVRLWLKVQALAEKLGLDVDLEVHRDTCTETPEKTYEIADRYEKATGRKLGICWDFSHIAVVKHLSPPFADRLLERPELVRLSRQFHFRPFNGHHCQIPATDGKGNETPEFKDFLEFLDAVFACWFKGAKGGEIVYACPEFGPLAGGYGLSAFPNVWKDAIHLRARTEEIWKANLKKFKAAGK